mgnify:CR=1 FL=1
MNEQFLQMQYEYYRKETPTNYLTYNEWKSKVTSCVESTHSCIPYLIAGIVVGYILKKK